MRKTKDGCYRALCGQCGGQLSLAISPGRGGIQHENWVLVAPDSPEVSAAPGFSRRYDDDGQPVYSLIRPRFIKAVLGNTRLDQNGRFIHRVKDLRTWAG
jgi:hypothetical protein